MTTIPRRLLNRPMPFSGPVNISVATTNNETDLARAVLDAVEAHLNQRGINPNLIAH